MKKRLPLILISMCACAITITVFAWIISSCSSNTQKTTWIESGETIASETVNDIEWKLHFTVFRKQNYTEYKNTLSYITATYSENERNSVYYERLSKKHGDNSIFITHEFSMKGTPIGENWYIIEQTETIKCGWGCDGVLATKTIRHEKNLFFNSLS